MSIRISKVPRKASHPENKKLRARIAELEQKLAQLESEQSQLKAGESNRPGLKSEGTAAGLGELARSNLIGILFGDIDGHISDANEALLEIIGYSRQELYAGQIQWTELTPPEWTPLDVAAVAEAKTRGVCTPYEKEYIHKSGQRVPVLVGFVLLGETPHELVAFILDLTRQKQDQEQLDFQARVLSEVYDSIIVVDNEARIAYWNKGAERLYGLKPDQTLGRKIRDIYQLGWDNPAVKAAADEALAKTGYWAGEHFHLKPNGERIHVAVAISTLTDRTGARIGRLSVTRDITTRKKLEQRLALLAEVGRVLATDLDYKTRAEEVVKLLVPTIADFCIFDSLKPDDSLERVAWKHVDPAQKENFDLIARFVPPSGNKELPVMRVLNSRQTGFWPQIKPEWIDKVALSPEHAEFFRSLRATSLICVPILARGHTLGVLTFGLGGLPVRYYDQADLELVQEVAGRVALTLDNARLYEESQKAVLALQEINTLKDQFLSIASHELKTPLTAISGFAQMLQMHFARQARPDSTPNLKQFLERGTHWSEAVVHQADRMNELIGRLLDFSRIKTGQLNLDLDEPANLVEFVRKLVEQHGSTTENRRISFVSQETEIMVQYDEARLEQVLNNLISNALKYSPASCPVVVGIEKQAEKERAVIWVRDQGYGVSRENQPHLFEQFYRVRTEQSRSIEGLGLGLYISSEIVAQHGGQIWLESEEGKGSTFYFSIPLKGQEM